MTWLAVKAFLGTAWGFLRAIPWQVWPFLAIAAAFWWYGERRFDAGQADERGRWEAAQAQVEREAAEKEAKRDEAAEAVNDTATERGHKAVTETRTETAAAVERARHEGRIMVVPANCPTAVSDRVRDEGRAAVERARAAGGGMRARPDARRP